MTQVGKALLEQHNARGKTAYVYEDLRLRRWWCKTGCCPLKPSTFLLRALLPIRGYDFDKTITCCTCGRVLNRDCLALVEVM